MTTDLILAVLHHLGAFAVAGFIAAEWALVRPGINADRLKQVSKLDMLYGGVAGFVFLIGFARVFFGPKGAEFYLQNPVFWAKIGAFALVGMVSIAPTLLFITWRNRAKTGASFTPSAEEIASVRRYIKIEAHIFVLIPILAAAMARGYGL